MATAPERINLGQIIMVSREAPGEVPWVESPLTGYRYIIVYKRSNYQHINQISVDFVTIQQWFFRINNTIIYPICLFKCSGCCIFNLCILDA